MAKTIGFKEFNPAEYMPGQDPHVNYRAIKRKKADQEHEGFVSAAQRKAVWATKADGGKGHPDNKKKAKKESVEVDEALTLQQRRKRSILMKRLKGRIAIGRKRAMKRTASLDVLKKRANKAARNLIFKKISKGKPKSEVSPQRRAEIEKRLDKIKPRIQKIAMRLVPKLRKAEQLRRQGKTGDSAGKGIGLPSA